jgi:hypothetical protein
MNMMMVTQWETVDELTMDEQRSRRHNGSDCILSLATVLADILHRDVVNLEAPVFEYVNALCKEEEEEGR